ncbi:MAG: shikimate kinase, partial [Actinobacteria bacterium]|nr:shikimate kinase [Actinomycetota bacterium]
SLEEAYERLKDSNDRPLLKVKDEGLKQKIAQIMQQRQDIYDNNCDLKINVDEKSPNSLKEEILNYLKNN